jgi:hypothetical protein
MRVPGHTGDHLPGIGVFGEPLSEPFEMRMSSPLTADLNLRDYIPVKHRAKVVAGGVAIVLLIWFQLFIDTIVLIKM